MATTVKTVQVVVSGDSSGAQKALGELSDKSASTASSIRSKVSGLFSTLNNSGLLNGATESILGLSDSFSDLELKGKAVSDQIAGIGVAAAGAGAAMTLIGQGDKTAEATLENTFKNAGLNIEDYKGKIDDTVSSMAKYGYTSAQTDNALSTLVAATKNPTLSLQAMSVAANLAAARHESLTTATDQVVQVLGGKGTRTLQAFGLTLKQTAISGTQLTSAQNAVTTATTSFNNAASAVVGKIMSIGTSNKASNAAIQTAITGWNNYAAAVKKYGDNSPQAHAALATYQNDLKGIGGQSGLTMSQQYSLQQAQDKVTTSAQNLAKKQQTLATDTKTMANAGTQGKNSLDQLASKIKGDASVQADTFTGKMKALRAEIENNVAALGNKYGPAITAAGAGMTVLGGAVQGVQKVLGLFKTATEATAVAEDAQAVATGVEDAALAVEDTELAVADVAEGIALAPILLIIAAVVALGVGIYELVTHWSTVWAAIKATAEAVWTALQAIFKAIVTVAVDSFNSIVGFFKALPGDIEKIGSDMLNVGKALINGVVTGVRAVWSTMSSIFVGIPTDVYNWIVAGAGWLVNVGSGLINWIVRGVDAVGSSLWNIFMNVPVNAYNHIVAGIGWLYNAGVGLLNNVIHGVDAVAGSLWGFFNGIAQNAYSHVVGGVGWLYNAGVSLLDNILRGVGAMTGSLWNIFGGMAHWLYTAVVGEAGWLYNSGISVMDNLLRGVGAVTSSLWNIFSGFGSWLYRAVASGAGNLIAAGYNLIVYIVQGIERAGGMIWNAIKGSLPSGGIVGSALSAIGLAEGGIVTKPTLAMVGEAGYPEAVIPLKDSAAVKGYMNDGVLPLPGQTGIGTNTKGTSANGATYNVTQNISLPTGTPQQFAQETTWQLSRLAS